MNAAAVDCVFAADGTVKVNRVNLGNGWRPASQGRQWLDQGGRHILIMLPGEAIYELILRSDTMLWEIARGRGEVRVV